eukprot:CAMPEP_0168451404 /NCGR_PEP_ID=MMETSP0228-20121227/48617_1 /TAXON_ID=133427 /ORGANISM="Protoceratium reticulatum, Strain CCCM 535 (=CCMP 1889)" /LENGTH=61 /DNA_ID=CAMNT_0008466017 /DNA_START=296 /DNA_END=477 /DNA_ORIENTATION=-
MRRNGSGRRLWAASVAAKCLCRSAPRACRMLGGNAILAGLKQPEAAELDPWPLPSGRMRPL